MAFAVRAVGRAARGIGKALDTVGVILQDKPGYVEKRESQSCCLRVFVLCRRACRAPP